MITKSTFQVVMRTDGKHQVIVTVEDPSGIDAALAVARATYAKLLKDEELTPLSGSTELQQPAPVEAAPACPMHHRVMSWVANGRRGRFWSCRKKNADGSWCTYTRQPD
jgi:hypothetical protein